MERQHHLSISFSLLLLIALFSTSINALGDPFHQPLLRANEDVGKSSSHSIEGENERHNPGFNLRRKSRKLDPHTQDYLGEESAAIHQQNKNQPNLNL